MIQLPSDFKDLLKCLNAKSVEYLLVGGYAVGYHGYPRATADIDIWIAVSASNARQVAEALHEFGFPSLTSDLFSQPGQGLRLGNPPLRIEFLTAISGVEFKECYSRRIQGELDGVPVTLISREDLLRNKRSAGRFKDLEDVLQISARAQNDR